MTTLDQVATELLIIKQKIAELTSQKKQLETALSVMAEPEILAQLSGKDYGAGTATIVSEKYKIKYVVSKKVKWNQEMLDGVSRELVARGEDPREYITVKFDVSENAYKNWPISLQSIFESARTVEIGSPTITIEEK